MEYIKDMIQNKKAITHHTKKAVMAAKSSRLQSPHLKLSFLSRLLPRNKKAVIKMSVSLVVVIAIAGAIPLPYTFAKTVSIPFTSTNQESAELELGDTKNLQDGANGSKYVDIDALQSIWGRLLGLQPTQQKEKTSTISKASVDKIVVNGTRKYQYMLCSDGGHSYYTDEQFKDVNTGFTSKSEDRCKKNGQGEMIRLSDTASGSESATSTSGRSPTVTTRGGCTYTSIPYETVYRDASWLNKGETSVSPGSDGTKSSCGWSTNPIDEVILRGTSESGGSSSSGNSNNQDSAAYIQCQIDYNSAMSQIQASISQGMSGQDALKGQVESEFSRCKRAAGF